jgi:hypothetical protein
MNARTAVTKLVAEISRANPNAVFPKPRPEEIAGAEGRLGFRFPQEFREFLSLCNGAEVGRSGLYGIKTEKRFFDLERSYGNSPQFKRWKMLPVAGDGCGNFYLLDRKDRHVYFYDAISDDEPGYVVASDFWHFAYFYITEPLEKRGWPVEKAYVLKIDPEMAKPCKAPPIWET